RPHPLSLHDALPISDEFGSMTEDDFYRSVNHVEPSLIRVDADEVTYNFHIIIRFELEQELIEGRVEVAEMPEWFDAKMDEYLGRSEEHTSELQSPCK